MRKRGLPRVTDGPHGRADRVPAECRVEHHRDLHKTRRHQARCQLPTRPDSLDGRRVRLVSEMLRWTAAGKNADGIGLILGISERTVNFLIASALVKLNVANKTQAVITAVMLGMLY